MDKNITINNGDGGQSVTVPQHVYEQFLSAIDGTEVEGRLENGTEELSAFWTELRTLAPNYAKA